MGGGQSTSSHRRRLLTAAAGVSLGTGLGACATPVTRRYGRVVVIGGGHAGVAAARGLKASLGEAIDVCLIERRPAYVAAPLANQMLGNLADEAFAYQTYSYAGLRRAGILVILDSVESVDLARRQVRLARGNDIGWDRLVIATGASPRYADIAGWSAELAATRIPSALVPGPAFLALSRRLVALPPRSTVIVGIPRRPVSGPMAGYERATRIASWLAEHRPGSRLVVLDANAGPDPRGPDFMARWHLAFSGIVDYQPANAAVAVQASAGRVTTEFNDVIRGDLITLLPAMDAGPLPRSLDLLAPQDHWCDVNWRTFESTRVSHVHLAGDLLNPPRMPADQRQLDVLPKTAGLAIVQGQLLAASLTAQLQQREISPAIVEAVSVTAIDSKEGWSRRDRLVFDADGRSLNLVASNHTMGSRDPVATSAPREANQSRESNQPRESNQSGAARQSRAGNPTAVTADGDLGAQPFDRVASRYRAEMARLFD